MTATVSSPRRRLGGRQAERVAAIVDAAMAELRANGYEGLTVRNAARRAGVAAATAYSYFGSKDHLVAEVFWRRLSELPPPSVDRRRRAAARVSAALRDLLDAIGSEPALAAAATSALLATDADVDRLRTRIGVAIDERIALALADDGGPAVRRALNLALAGALLQAGMGYLSYDELPGRMDEVVGALLGGPS